MEKFFRNFPQYGKNFRLFSTLWKTRREGRPAEAGLKTFPALQHDLL